MNWVASFPTLMRMGPLRLSETLLTLMSERGASSGVDEVLSDYFALADEIGGDFSERVWVESPLQTDATLESPSTARVRVWAALITGDAEAGPVEVLWRTHHITLVWERDDWRIDTVDVVEGPTPVAAQAALPSPPSEFRTVDAWIPAVFADTTPGTR